MKRPRIIELTFEFLKQRPAEKFYTSKIAQWIFENYETECREIPKNSKAKVHPVKNEPEDIIGQLTAIISASKDSIKKKYSQIKINKIGGNLIYYYTESSDDEEIQQAEAEETISTDKKNNSKPEFELYQKLSNYLLSADPKVYTKRIDEGKSSNKRGSGANKWLHPDIVGLEVLNQDWISEIKTCAGIYYAQKARLWSFEVKTIITLSNVRDCFLQAVTNSSWAHFGYLVASEIREDAMSEVRILANLHGIGFIELNAANYLESQILISAKEKAEVDWNTANRLADENNDFKGYIELIIDFHKSDKNKIKEHEWDGQAIEA